VGVHPPSPSLFSGVGTDHMYDCIAVLQLLLQELMLKLPEVVVCWWWWCFGVHSCIYCTIPLYFGMCRRDWGAFDLGLGDIVAAPLSRTLLSEVVLLLVYIII